MNVEKIIEALRRMKVETGSLMCISCGHEHNCGIHGCAIMSMAADRLANDQTHITALQKEIEALQKRLELSNAERDANTKRMIELEQGKKWIPVTERLPKDRGDVLVAAYWHERWGVYMGWCAPQRAEWSVHNIKPVVFSLNDISSFGKTVFLTREEAEKALRRNENA